MIKITSNLLLAREDIHPITKILFALIGYRSS